MEYLKSNVGEHVVQIGPGPAGLQHLQAQSPRASSFHQLPTDEDIGDGILQARTDQPPGQVQGTDPIAFLYIPLVAQRVRPGFRQGPLIGRSKGGPPRFLEKAGSGSREGQKRAKKGPKTGPF